MPGEMLIIDPDGSKRWTSGRDKPPDIDVLQGAVGGYIESVPHFDSVRIMGTRRQCVVFCHEEGKLLGLPFNPEATRLWFEAAPHMEGQDVLVGPIVVLWGD